MLETFIEVYGSKLGYEFVRFRNYGKSEIPQCISGAACSPPLGVIRFRRSAVVGSVQDVPGKLGQFPSNRTSASDNA